MIRDALSNLITQVANISMPGAVGSEWKDEHFTVLLQNMAWHSPVNIHMDDYWDGIAQLSGTAMVRVFTDERRPLDLTRLMIDLFVPPIPCVFEPSPQEFSPGEYSVRLHWKPTEMTDMLWESGVVPVLRGELDNCYVLRRNETAYPATTPSTAKIDINIIPPMFTGACR